MKRKEWRILPPQVFFLFGLTAWLLHRFVPLAEVVPGGLQRAGWFVAALGLILGGVGAGLFRRRGTSVRPTRESLVLVTDGPYRFSRNPMYLGMLLMLVGEAIVLGSASPWLVPVAHVVLFTVHFIRWEEAALTAHFGAEYEDFRRRVRRWI
jgi:protein-S-isoprenylcysteine O-methyltransferase Ste14